MKVLTLTLSILAFILVVFNATKLNFNAIFEGESFTAILTIIAALCVILLLQILRVSKKIEALDSKK